MLCPSCGTTLPDNSTFCTSCGTALSNGSYAPKIQEKRSSAILFTIIAIIFVAALICTVVYFRVSAKANLKEKLLLDWEYYFVGEDPQSLDFSEDTVNYINGSLLLGETVNTYTYTVLSGSRFRIEELDTVYTVSFNDELGIMTIFPAIRTDAPSEDWYNLD